MPKEGPHDPAVCPACGGGLTAHWRCLLCQCFGHANVQARNDKAICRGCDNALARRGKRRCKACGEIKAIKNFNLTDGFRRRKCKTCQRKMPAYRASDARGKRKRREAIRAAQRRRYAVADPERAQAQRRAKYERNRGRILAYHARYRKDPANQARIQVWRAQNKERIRETRRAREVRQLLHILRGER